MRKPANWDPCPSYPKDVAAAESLEARFHNTPSLHLAFGLGSDVTVEALVHQYAELIHRIKKSKGHVRNL